MMLPEIAIVIDRMTSVEKHELIGEIWDTLDHDSDSDVSPKLRAELDRRLDAIERGEMGFRDWEDIKAEWAAERETCRAA